MRKAEKFNAISHLAGAALALCGLAALVTIASLQGDPWKIVSFGIYGAALFVLYLCSTLYHSLRGPAKQLFRTFDHLSIYLLIAGTYTPFTLVALGGAWGWSLFGSVWLLAFLGIFLELPPKRGRRILPVVIYLLMGWLILIAYRPLIHSLSYPGFLWLLFGGLFYSVGVVFYTLGDRIRHFHGIWHLFVLAGSMAHFAAILFYVA